MPVPVSPINRQLRPVPLQLRFQRADQVTSLLIDRALTLEVVIMFRNREHSFARDVPSAQHVFKEGKYFFFRFGTSERNHQNGVVVHVWIDTWSGLSETEYVPDRESRVVTALLFQRKFSLSES